MASEVAETLPMTDRLQFREVSKESQSEALAPVIERAKAGDYSAFEHIITHHQHRVLATAWRMLGNQEDARDAAQEVFLRVYKYLKRFRQGEDFSAWLYRIVVNVCRDSRRKRSRHNQFASLETEKEVGAVGEVPSSDDVEAAAIVSQQRAIITKALHGLSRKEREAIVLRDLEGLSTEEVARILGSSPATVRSQISSARSKIKLFRDRLLNRGLRRVRP